MDITRILSTQLFDWLDLRLLRVWGFYAKKSPADPLRQAACHVPYKPKKPHNDGDDVRRSRQTRFEETAFRGQPANETFDS